MAWSSPIAATDIGTYRRIATGQAAR